MKITRNDLRKIILETIRKIDDPRGNIENISNIGVSKHGGPTPDHPFYTGGYNPAAHNPKLDNIGSQQIADAKRAVGDDPVAQAKYLQISVEDWWKIRNDLDDWYEERHMLDQMEWEDEVARDEEIENLHPLDVDGDGKLTISELRKMISEQADAAQDSPSDLYDRLLFLRNEHGGEFSLFERLGEDGYREVISIRDEILADPNLSGYDGYKEFFNRVGPPAYNRMTGGRDQTNEFGLFPQTVRELYDERYGKVSIEDIIRLKSEHDELLGKFKTQDGTNIEDSVYGRKRSDIVHIDSGEIVNTSTDRKGSLGT